MNRIITFVLVLILVLALCGCGQEAPATESNAGAFCVGYGRADITPLTSVPLAGYGNSTQRMSETILDLQYATCLAIADEQENTVLLISIDQQRASDVTVKAVRPLISAETGIPEDHIMFCATHTHSGPDLTVVSNEAIQAYIPYLNEQLCQAARDAVADLKPATMEAGSIETEAMNFTRHYSYIDENGQMQYFGDSFGTPTYNDTTKHITEVDPTMYLVRFTQDDGNEIVLVNWRAHPSSTGWGNGGPLRNVSSDYIGSFRDAMEQQTGCRFVYFNGACGNVNSSSRITSENRVSSNNERGSVLADYAIECLNNNMEPVETGLVCTKQKVLDMEIDHDYDSMVTQAKMVSLVFSQTGSNAEAIEAGKPYGIRSPYHANAIMSRAGKEATADVEINAIVIGDSLSIVTTPNEYFDRLGVQVEEGSPYKYTLFFGYANSYRGYIPDTYGFEYTSYETDVCWFYSGCGETIRDTMLELLDQLYEG